MKILPHERNSLPQKWFYVPQWSEKSVKNSVGVKTEKCDLKMAIEALSFEIPGNHS